MGSSWAGLAELAGVPSFIDLRGFLSDFMSFREVPAWLGLPLVRLDRLGPVPSPTCVLFIFSGPIS